MCFEKIIQKGNEISIKNISDKRGMKFLRRHSSSERFKQQTCSFFHVLRIEKVFRKIRHAKNATS